MDLPGLVFRAQRMCEFARYHATIGLVKVRYRYVLNFNHGRTIQRITASGRPGPPALLSAILVRQTAPATRQGQDKPQLCPGHHPSVRQNKKLASKPVQVSIRLVYVYYEIIFQKSPSSSPKTFIKTPTLLRSAEEYF